MQSCDVTLPSSPHILCFATMSYWLMVMLVMYSFVARADHSGASCPHLLSWHWESWYLKGWYCFCEYVPLFTCPYCPDDIHLAGWAHHPTQIFPPYLAVSIPLHYVLSCESKLEIFSGYYVLFQSHQAITVPKGSNPVQLLVKSPSVRQTPYVISSHWFPSLAAVTNRPFQIWRL